MNTDIEEPITVKPSKFGRGVFATRHIKKGELICRMKGQKISDHELGTTEELGRSIVVDPLQINTSEYLNLYEPYVLINHSCDPNAGLKNIVDLIAIKSIKKGEQILYDYSTTWYDGMECHCGSKKCRKHISDYYSIPKRIRKMYRKLDIVPPFIVELDGA